MKLLSVNVSMPKTEETYEIGTEPKNPTGSKMLGCGYEIDYPAIFFCIDKYLPTEYALMLD